MSECESCGRWVPGRTEAEVTAAAERTADITLRLVAVTRERDALREQVARVRALAQRWDARADDFMDPVPMLMRAHATRIRATLDQPEEQP